MKPAERVLDVTSTLEGEKIGMDIDQSALAHIMSVLTDLYSDTELAILREYSTNAFDAHIEAGIKRPIEVTLPSNLSPFVRIRDFGEGLDVDDIRDIYSKYGASTKRTSNDVVGMLGLGCKSALTYTDQFTLTGIKDGIMTQVSVSRDEDGTGSMTIVYQGETDDEQGVEIIVPAKRHHDFAAKAKNFFRFWPEGSVLVNEKAPERIDGVWIADDLLLTQDADESVIVMGNVPYPMLEDTSTGLGNKRYDYNLGRYVGTHVVAFVSIGEVNFVPSRENLQPTAQTKATLAKVRERIRVEKNPAFERLIAAAKTKVDALAVYYDVVDVGYDGEMPKWNGYEIPREWRQSAVTSLDSNGQAVRDRNGQTVTHQPQFLVCQGQKTYRRKETSMVRTIPNQPRKYGWIINFDGAELTPYKRQKLNIYMDENNVDIPENWVLVDTLPEFKHPDGTSESPKDWFPTNRILDWDDVNKVKIVREKVQRRDGRPSGSYKGFANGNENMQILAAEIDTSKPIFYEVGSTNYWGIAQTHSSQAIRTLYPDATLIILGKNRLAKFVRDFPMAKQTASFLSTEGKKWSDGLTEQQKLILHFKNDTDLTSTLNRLKPLKDSLLDEELRKAIDLAGIVDNKLYETYKVWKRWGVTVKTNFKNPLHKYVLLTHVSSYARLSGEMKDHVILYLNSAYSAEQEETV